MKKYAMSLVLALTLTGCINPAVKRLNNIAPKVEELVMKQAAAKRSQLVMSVAYEVPDDECDTLADIAFLMGWQVKPLLKPNPCAHMMYDGTR